MQWHLTFGVSSLGFWPLHVSRRASHSLVLEVFRKCRLALSSDVSNIARHSYLVPIHGVGARNRCLTGPLAWWADSPTDPATCFLTRLQRWEKGGGDTPPAYAMQKQQRTEEGLSGEIKEYE